MVAPFSFLHEILLILSQNGGLYKISLFIFIFCLSFGCILLLLINCFDCMQKTGYKWLYYLYQTAFFLDLCVCFAECELVGFYYVDFSSCAFGAFLRFALLIVLYGVICFQKNILSRDKKANKLKDGTICFYNEINSKNEKTQKEKNLSDFIKIDERMQNLPAQSEIEINRAYLFSIADALLGKNLTDEERDFVNELVFDLRGKNVYGQSQINAKLQKLVKLITEYEISA